MDYLAHAFFRHFAPDSRMNSKNRTRFERNTKKLALFGDYLGRRLHAPNELPTKSLAHYSEFSSQIAFAKTITSLFGKYLVPKECTLIHVILELKCMCILL